MKEKKKIEEEITEKELREQLKKWREKRREDDADQMCFAAIWWAIPLDPPLHKGDTMRGVNCHSELVEESQKRRFDYAQRDKAGWAIPLNFSPP